MEEPTHGIHPFSYSSAMSIEPKEVNPIYGMEESVSFGRFTSESLSWEKWSTFNRNQYVEEAEKYSKPGSVMQKKAFLEAHFKRMTTVKDGTASPDETSTIQEAAPTESNVDDTTLENHNELQSSINDQTWVEEEVEIPDFGHHQNEDKSNSEEVQLSSIDVVGSDQAAQTQVADLMDVEKQNPVTEMENGLTKTQEFGSQRSSINQENPASAFNKRTPLSSYIPSVEAETSVISSSTPENPGVKPPAMVKKKSPLYKVMNSKLIKKMGLSSKTSKNSQLKTRPKEKSKDKLCIIFLCGSKPQPSPYREEV